MSDSHNIKMLGCWQSSAHQLYIRTPRQQLAALSRQLITVNSTARFKLDARKYILASTNTFLSSSQQMLTSKGSMLLSKCNMLLCMILLATELDGRVQLVARIIMQSVDAPEQDYMLSCIILLAI